VALLAQRLHDEATIESNILSDVEHRLDTAIALESDQLAKLKQEKSNLDIRQAEIEDKHQYCEVRHCYQNMD